MRRDKPLTIRQLEVLQWINRGSPEGVWPDFTYKTTAYALAARGLVTVDRRRKQWSASLTNAGHFYVKHGKYASPRYAAEGAESSETVPDETVPDRDDPASELLAALQAGDGNIVVASPSDEQRARYRRAIHRVIAERRVPEGLVLRHTGRDRGDLTVRLAPKDEAPQHVPPLKVVVPVPGRRVSDEVRTLGNRVRMVVTEPTMERALRIVQAIADECARRNWTLQPDPQDERRFEVATAECTFELSLREELVDREMPDDDVLQAAKYPWQRIPRQVNKVGSGRLTLQLGQYYRVRSWADRRRWTLEDKLGALLVELDARIAEAAESRRRREAELSRRQQAWDAAVLEAKQAFTVDLNRRWLQDQVTRKRLASDYRDYAGSLDAVADRCGDPAAAAAIRAWRRWALDEADRIDPLSRSEDLRYLDPDQVTVEEYSPFMPTGLNAHHRPTM